MDRNKTTKNSVMPKKGQTITNPTNGDRYTFLETAGDTQGRHVIMQATIHSKGPLVPNHFHVFQEECFEVLSGQLTVFFQGDIHQLSAGDKIALPENVPHNHYNDQGSPVTYIHTVSPALDFDYLIENLVGLAADGKSKNGQYGLIQQLVSLRYLDSKSYLADIPVGVQKLLMYVLAPVGRLMGYRAIYKKYSGIEK